MSTPPYAEYASSIDLLQALQVPLDNVLVKHPIHYIDMWIMLFKTQAQAKMTQGFSVDA